MPSSVLSQVEGKKSESTLYTIPQVMMTLAQLAVTAGAQRPSGETLQQQQERIYNGINAQLSNEDLATNGEWQAVWVGLTNDRANLAYIAHNTSQNAFAVCLRGTQMDSFIDQLEDLDVGKIEQFKAGPSYSESIYVSKGANGAFNEVIKAVYVSANTNLLQALTSLLESAPPKPTLYITGHSLGGAMATTVALYLVAQNWANKPTFGVYTFAAPTAGLQSFADCFDNFFGSVSERYYNAWDAVPAAWANSSMTDMQNSFYPSIVTNPQGPGPAQNADVVKQLNNFMTMPNGNVYVQTNQQQGSVKLNLDYSKEGTTDFGPGSYNTLSLVPTMDGFMGQVGFQHNNYLGFLGAPQIPSLVPVISSPISPNAGPLVENTVVTIEGSNFTPDCLVDFKPEHMLGAVAAKEVTFISENKLTAKSPWLLLPATLDVRVTNNFGTSAVTPVAKFTVPPPTSAPAVSAITPNSGPAETGYTVTINGTGFTSDCTVFFGETQVAQEQTIIVSLTEISVQPPASESGIVAVTVTTTGSPGSSTTPTFTYGPPVVTGVTPSFGFTNKKDNASVTISGAGFGSSQGNGTVQFVSLFVSNSCQSIVSWSDTEIVVTPPEWVELLLSNVPCEITVTNSNGLASDKAPADQYTYYNSLFLKS
jgi:hypothetical protein